MAILSGKMQYFNGIAVWFVSSQLSGNMQVRKLNGFSQKQAMVDTLYIQSDNKARVMCSYKQRQPTGHTVQFTIALCHSRWPQLMT